MYLAGLGKLTRNLGQFQDNIPAEYGYDVLTRMFLMSDLYPNTTTDEARNAYLLSALAVLPESSDRYQIYTSWILRTWLRRNNPAPNLARSPCVASSSPSHHRQPSPKKRNSVASPAPTIRLSRLRKSLRHQPARNAWPSSPTPFPLAQNIPAGGLKSGSSAG